MKNFLGTKFGVTAFSTYRAGDDDGTGHGHSSGLAVHFMVDSAKRDELAAYLKANYSELGVYPRHLGAALPHGSRLHLRSSLDLEPDARPRQRHRQQHPS